MNAIKLGSAAITGGAVLATGITGYAVASSMTRDAYRKDLTGERTRFVGSDGATTFEGPSPKLGPWLMVGSLVFGGLTAALGAGWRGRALEQASIAAKQVVTGVKLSAGVKLATGALMGAGIGMAGGGISASMFFKDVSTRRAIPGDVDAAEAGDLLEDLLPLPGEAAPAPNMAPITPTVPAPTAPLPAVVTPLSPDVQALLDQLAVPAPGLTPPAPQLVVPVPPPMESWQPLPAPPSNYG